MSTELWASGVYDGELDEGTLAHLRSIQKRLEQRVAFENEYSVKHAYSRPRASKVSNVPSKPALSTTDGENLRRAGWTLSGTRYVGWFRFPASPPIRGRIEIEVGRPEVSFHRPPLVVQKHVCVHKRSDGWFYLHPHGPPKREPVSATVLSVQVWLQGLLCKDGGSL